ncbi:MAG: hypothetical protein APF76_06475 [Desulfitibacter sp. BRH_c19]|nr:MAG: hypothetical protein APF76_06475 [Desulfitibacter sp. BRH_c19]
MSEIQKQIDLSTQIAGVKLKSPFVLASGPLSFDAEGMIRAYRAGAGACVTKTLRDNAAINPVPHIGSFGRDTLINCEKWSDFDADIWIEKEIPKAKKEGVVVIGSIGHTPEEAKNLVKAVADAGADMIELVSYSEDTMIPMVDIACRNANIPIICKMSPNWPDPASTAVKCLEAGAQAISAIDSIGPTLKIDIYNARPEMNSEDGYGWMSGSAIRPIAIRIVSEIARKDCKELIGIGGVTKAEEAVEMLMAGAGAVGVCSIAMLKGIGVFEKLNKNLSKLLAELGYSSIEAVKGAALPNFPKKEIIGTLDFKFDESLCTKCKKCEIVCCYLARKLEFPQMKLDEDLCRYCGLCISTCPTGALKGKVSV